LSWRYANTITHRSVQVELPARPKLAFAQRVEQLGQFFMQLAIAAPLLTGVFLVFWFAIVKIESLAVANENTLLLGIGFFMFYPLFIFLAGFIDLSLAFAIALIVAGGLVVGYGVRVLGGQRVTIYLMPLLIVFYGLLTRGLTEPRYLGLMLVISAVLLVGLFMWRIGQRKRVEPIQQAEQAAPVEAVTSEPSPQPVTTARYCVHCGQRTAGDFKFCPQCGQGAQATRQCAGCGLEYIPAGDAPSFCPACGRKQ